MTNADITLADPLKWYAVRVRSRAEWQVESALEGCGFRTFLPSWIQKVRWSDRVTETQRPLFPGYLFARFDRLEAASRVLAVTGLIQILGHDELSSVSADEIDNLRRVCESPTVSLCAYVAGEKVTVSKGPLAGLTGIVTRTAGVTRLVVLIDILNRAVATEIDAADVEKDKK